MIAQVSPSQLSAWLQTARAHGTPVVLDVREPSELLMASIKADGFTLLAIPMGVIPLRLSELDPEQPIACLCHHGIRSQQVATFLTQGGFTDVVNLQGGIAAWSEQIDPTVPLY